LQLKLSSAEVQRMAGIPIVVSDSVSTGISFLPAQNFAASSRRCSSTELGEPMAHALLSFERWYSFSPVTANLAPAQPDSRAEMIRLNKTLFFVINLQPFVSLKFESDKA